MHKQARQDTRKHANMRACGLTLTPARVSYRMSCTRMANAAQRVDKNRFYLIDPESDAAANGLTRNVNVSQVAPTDAAI
jgi:hypothetical protein